MAGGVARQLGIPGGNPASQPGPRSVGSNVVGFPQRKPTGEPLQFPRKDPNGPWNKENPSKPSRGPLANPNKFEESVADAKRKADAGWGKRYREGRRSTYQKHAEAVINDQIRRELEPGITWQPWKDRSRPLSRPLPKNPPPLKPINIAQEGAKRGALELGKKKVITVAPIIGQIIGGIQLGGDIAFGISELAKAGDRALGIEGWEDWKQQPFPNPIEEPDILEEPAPTEFPNPFPSPGDFIDDGGKPFEGNYIRGEGIHKVTFRLSQWTSAWLTELWSGEILSVFTKGFGFIEGTVSLWIFGPATDFQWETDVWRSSFSTAWSVTRHPFIWCWGMAYVNPDSPDVYNPNDSQPYKGYQNDKLSKLYLYSALQGGVGGAVVASYSASAGRGYYEAGSGTVVSDWGKIGEEEIRFPGGMSPETSGGRNQQEEPMNCPNIKPILQAHQQQIIQLIQQGIPANIAEASITQISNNVATNVTTDVTNSVNQNVTNQINTQMQNLTTNVNTSLANLQTSLQTSLNNFSTSINAQLNTALSTLGDSVNSIKNSVTQATAEILQKIDKVSKWLQLDRILNVWTFVVTLHNAAMLSNNLLQSVTQMFQNLATVMGNALGLRSVDDEPIDISQQIGSSLTNILNTIFGAENVVAAKREWAKLSTIFTAANNLMMALQGLNDAVLGAVSVVAERSAFIGNALKKWGEVGENAYRWMNPSINFNNKFFTTLERMENQTQSIDSVTMQVAESQQIVNELPKQLEELNKALSEADDAPTPKTPAPEAAKTASAESAAKTASQSPDIADADLQSDEVG